MYTVITILAAIAVFYSVVAIGFYVLQPLLVYKPKRDRVNPQDLGLENVEEILLDTIDGEQQVAWHVPAQPGFPTILYYHGTTGSLSNRRDRILRMTRRGYGVFMPSYRSYSGSTGKPTQGWLTCDAILAYDYLIENLNVAKEKVVIYGESLGTGLAVPVASVRNCAALVLEAPYTSIVDVAESRFPFLPIRNHMQERFESWKVIDKVKAPLLVLHGGKDKVIPIELGRKMYNAANEPKEMIEFSEAGHTGIFMMGAFSKIHAFLEQHIKIPGAAVTPFKKTAAE